MSGPNFDTGFPSQMSDPWINYVAEKLKSVDKSAVSDLIKKNPQLIQKYVAAIDRELGELNFLKLGKY